LSTQIGERGHVRQDGEVAQTSVVHGVMVILTQDGMFISTLEALVLFAGLFVIVQNSAHALVALIFHHAVGNS
jgi:hypothetical protein